MTRLRELLCRILGHRYKYEHGPNYENRTCLRCGYGQQWWWRDEHVI